MIFKKIKQSLMCCSGFDRCMNFIKEECSRKDVSVSEKIMLLDYVINVIANDIKYDLATKIIYNYPDDTNVPPVESIYIPLNYSNVDNMSLSTLSEEKEISFSDSNIVFITAPWEPNRLTNILRVIFRDGFKYHETNHYSYYFDYLKICFVYNGIHSCTAGSYFKKGFIKTQSIPIEKAFPHIHTDGVNWYDSHTNSVICEVGDYRFAAIYEIAKIKYELEKVRS